MKEKLKKAWIWLKDNAVWVASAITAIAVAIFTVKYLEKDEEIEIEKRKAKVASLEKEIADLEARRQLIKEKLETVDAKIKAVDVKDKEADREISKLKKNLVKEREALKNMTFNEKLKKFEDLGY